MANRAPSREDVDALVHLSSLLVDAAAVTRFLAQRWNIPAVTDALQSIASGLPPPDTAPHNSIHAAQHRNRASNSNLPNGDWDGQGHHRRLTASSGSNAGGPPGAIGDGGRAPGASSSSSSATPLGASSRGVAGAIPEREAAAVHVYNVNVNEDQQQQQAHTAATSSSGHPGHVARRLPPNSTASSANIPAPRAPANANDDEGMSVDDMILDSVAGREGGTDGGYDDDGSGEEDPDSALPSSPDFPRPRKRSHQPPHQQRPPQQHPSNQQNPRYSQPLSPNVQRHPHPQNPQNQWSSTEETAYYHHYQNQQGPPYPGQQQQGGIPDSRSASAPHLGFNQHHYSGGGANINPNLNNPNINSSSKARNNSNQHGQVRTLPTHRVPQPLVEGRVVSPNGQEVQPKVERVSLSPEASSARPRSTSSAWDANGNPRIYPSNGTHSPNPQGSAPGSAISPPPSTTTAINGTLPAHLQQEMQAREQRQREDLLRQHQQNQQQMQEQSQQHLQRYPSAPTLGGGPLSQQILAARAPPHTLSQESFASSTTSTVARRAAGAGGAERTHHPRRGAVPLAERLCSQCGKPGRFKDGRSVEKWGPGPEGPGTVCDKCRKKMKRLDRKVVAPPANGDAPPPHGTSPLAERTSPIAGTSQRFGGPQQQGPGQGQQHQQQQAQAEYRRERDSYGNLLAEAADAMPSAPGARDGAGGSNPNSNRHPQQSFSSPSLSPYADRSKSGSAPQAYERDRDSGDVLRTKQRQQQQHRVSPLSVSTAAAGGRGGTADADADGDLDLDAAVSVDEDDLIAEWADGPSRNRDNRAPAMSNGHNHHHNGPAHSVPRGLPVSDVRSSVGKRSEGSVTPVPSLGGGGNSAYEPHPAKRVKVEDAGDAAAARLAAKDKSRRRTPSFSPSPPPSPGPEARSQTTNPASGSASATSYSSAHTLASPPIATYNSAPLQQQQQQPQRKSGPRRSFQEMDVDPEADDFKSAGALPPTPTGTLPAPSLPSTILGKRARRASIDDELLGAATGEDDLSGEEMIERAAFYDGRSRSDSRSNSRSRSSSPMRMQMKTPSVLRQHQQSVGGVTHNAT